MGAHAKSTLDGRTVKIGAAQTARKRAHEINRKKEKHRLSLTRLISAQWVPACTRA